MLKILTVVSPVTRLLATLGQLVQLPRHPAAHTLLAPSPAAAAPGMGEFRCTRCDAIQDDADPLCVACAMALDEAASMHAADAHLAMHAAAEAAWFAAQVDQTSGAPLTPDQRFEALGQLPSLEAELHLELRRLEAVRQGHWLALTGQTFSS